MGISFMKYGISIKSPFIYLNPHELHPFLHAKLYQLTVSLPGRARNLSPAPTTGPVVSGIRWLGAPRGVFREFGAIFLGGEPWKSCEKPWINTGDSWNLSVLSGAKSLFPFDQSVWIHHKIFSSNPSGCTEHEVGWQIAVCQQMKQRWFQYHVANLNLSETV